MSQFTLWDGTYDKDPHIALIDGKEVPCWPNAGEMNATDGTDRHWTPEDNIQVRTCTYDEYFAVCKASKDTTATRRHVPMNFYLSPVPAPEWPKPKHSEGGIMAKAKWARNKKRKHS